VRRFDRSSSCLPGIQGVVARLEPCASAVPSPQPLTPTPLPNPSPAGLNMSHKSAGHGRRLDPARPQGLLPASGGGRETSGPASTCASDAALKPSPACGGGPSTGSGERLGGGQRSERSGKRHARQLSPPFTHAANHAPYCPLPDPPPHAEEGDKQPLRTFRCEGLSLGGHFPCPANLWVKVSPGGEGPTGLHGGGGRLRAALAWSSCRRTASASCSRRYGLRSSSNWRVGESISRSSPVGRS
jgi:hypothetical protein